MSDIVPILITAYSLASFGIISSGISLLIIYRIKILHNAFGLISAAQSVIDGSILFFNVFLTYTIVALNPENFSSITVIFAGLIISFCNSAVTILQLLKAVNRSIAIIFPTQYHHIFTIRKTTLYLFLIFMICISQTFSNLIGSCYLTQIMGKFSWAYYASSCTDQIGYISGTWIRSGTLAMTLFFDGITLFYLRLFRKRLIQHNKKMMKAEIRFFFQSCLTTIFYMIMLFSPRFLRPFSVSTFEFFLTVSATLFLFHSTNEFFFIIFTIVINKSLKISHHVTIAPMKLNNLQ